MISDFSFSEVVRICIPTEVDGRTGADVVLEGRVATVSSKTLSIAVRDADPKSSGAITTAVPCIVHKRTPFGLLEFDATGHSHWDEEGLTLTVTLEGARRRVQRRAACRIEMRSEARWRELSNGGSEWKSAELCDVSIGGASLHLDGEALGVGRELLIEFSLNDGIFSVPSVVRRIEGRSDHTRLYALEYIDVDTQVQDRLAKAISQLQLKIISSRVKID